MKALALLLSLPLLAFGKLSRRASSTTFTLFGYGPGVGGLPVFYADGLAYIGNHNASNSTDAATVTFTTGTDNAWLGSPNTTDIVDTSVIDWSNVTFYAPGPSSGTHQLGFASANSTPSDAYTTGFRFYGNTAMLLIDDSLETQWTSLPVGNGDIYALYWNDTSLGQTPITLRKTAPSNPSSRLTRR